MSVSHTDRRRHERFDVLGTLWGVLELPEPARLINVNRTGALIDAPVLPGRDSVQALRFLLGGDPVVVDATVRHAQSVGDGRFLVGLEFVDPPTGVLASIEQIEAGSCVEVFDSETRRS